MAEAHEPLAGTILGGGPSTNGDHAEWPATVLPPDFYDAREDLKRIRQYALAKMIEPDGLLAQVLALVALLPPLGVHLPPIIGTPVPLCYGVIPIGHSGAGKGIAHRITIPSTSTASRILVDTFGNPLLPDLRIQGISSGQGLTESLLERPDKHTVQPHGEPVLVYDDEGRVIVALAEERSFKLRETLCKAIFGETLSDPNATKDLRRHVPAGSYRTAISLPCIPEYVDGVITDVVGGVTQRFHFLQADGGNYLPRTVDELPDVPAPIKVPLRALGDYCEFDGVMCFGFPYELSRELQKLRLDFMHGNGDVRESHLGLLRSRLACLLAALAGRVMFDEADWQLAGVMISCSDAIVRNVSHWRAVRQQEADRRALEKATSHAVASDAAIEQDRVRRLAVDLYHRVRRETGLTRREHRARLSGGRRNLLDDAIDYAVKRDWIAEVEVPSHTDDMRRELRPGEGRP